MVARALVVACAVLLACGLRIVGGDGDASGSDVASRDDADSAGASSDDGSEGDMPLDDPSCRAALGHIGVVDWPHFIDGFQRASWFRAVGLVARRDR